jgi:hypothetical protein
MFAWFQRSTHVRSSCAPDVVCPDAADSNEPASKRPKRALRHTPVRTEVAVLVFASKLNVAWFAVDRLADRRLDQTAALEAAGARAGNAVETTG